MCVYPCIILYMYVSYKRVKDLIIFAYALFGLLKKRSSSLIFSINNHQKLIHRLRLFGRSIYAAGYGTIIVIVLWLIYKTTKLHHCVHNTRRPWRKLHRSTVITRHSRGRRIHLFDTNVFYINFKIVENMTKKLTNITVLILTIMTSVVHDIYIIILHYPRNSAFYFYGGEML